MTADADRPADVRERWKRAADWLEENSTGWFEVDGHIDCAWQDFFAALSAAGLEVVPAGEWEWGWRMQALRRDGTHWEPTVAPEQVARDATAGSDYAELVHRHVGPWEPVDVP